MIAFTKGNILESGCEALVNAVNCRGKVGRGLALTFKRRFPSMFLAYKRACDAGRVAVGSVHVWQDPGGGWVISFPTKDHWRQPSKLQWVVSGLEDLARVIRDKGIRSAAIPPLGCGLGGLLWYQVRAAIKKAHDRHWKDLKVVVYEP